MDLIKINLLPYREMREAKQKQQFQAIMMIGGLIGVAVAGAIYMYLSQAIETQESRNASLQTGMTELENQLKTIDELEKRKHNFLERKQKVEELDQKRFEGARIIDSLNQVVPQGSYLMTLRGTDGKGNKPGNEYFLEGKAVADTKIAALMAALPSTGIFDVPELVEIQKVDDGQKFTLKSILVDQVYKPKPVAATAASATKSASSATPPANK